jgi:Outer membrane protein beta-barrel domain
MKKVYLPFVFLLFTFIAKSQPQFGAFAGPQMNTAHYDIFDINVKKIKQETEMKFGFQAGVMMMIPFENKLFFSPAVYYNMKGYKVTFNRVSIPPDSFAVDNDVTLHTFDIAPMIQYNFSDNPGHFFIKAGPSINIHLFGNEKFNKTGGSSVDRKMKFSYSDYGRFGASLLLHLGYETSSGFIIYAQYNHGIGTLINTDGGPDVLTRCAGISIGKYFNRK